MNFTLQRGAGTRSTPGVLYAEGMQQLYTLELPVKDGKPGSAIPAGTYKIERAPSPRFMLSIDPWVLGYAKEMPHLLDIPGRSLIMVHFGNYVTETDGCILVGLTRADNFIGASRDAFIKFYGMLDGDDDILILDAPPPEAT